METQISQAPFGKTQDGSPVDIYTLRNPGGIEARICNYGGIIVSLKAPDRHGHLDDVVLGYDRLEGYLAKNPFFGALVGRVANRIALGKFTLEGGTYTLPINNGPNSLHGGLKGFDKVVWKTKQIKTATGPALEMNYVSKDGEEGYPGNLTVKALYSLTPDQGVRLDFTATTDKATILNLTQHSYFNLAGKGDILGHEVYIDADKYTPSDNWLIPSGEVRSVEGTPLDFRKPTAIGARIEQSHEALKNGRGYDTNYVLNHPIGRLDLIARVSEPVTGRVLEVLTTEPGLEFYTGNNLDGTIKGKGGQVYEKRAGVCLEPQHYPDSIHHPQFPTTILKPGEVYRNTIIYRFTTQP